MFVNGDINRKSKIILVAFFVIMLCLSIRLYLIQVHPTKVVQGELQNYQMETTSCLRYDVLDMNGESMLSINNRYVIVIDTKPFTLNNYEETLEDLLALNFIMKSEVPEFNYTDIMQSTGKVYYEVTEETFNKINQLTELKGIYSYIYEEPDKKEGWRIENIFASLDDEEPLAGSIQEKILNYLNENQYDTCNYYLDDKAVYSIKEENEKTTNKDIQLTINSDWTEKIRTVLNSEDYSFLENVGVVLLESDTGKIRAIVQKDESAANVCLGIGSIGYEPGSIFKVLTEAMALDLGITNVDDVYNCNGDICTKNGESYAHGPLSVDQALQVSCNDIFAHLGAEIGYSNMINYTKALGLYNQILGLSWKDKEESFGIMPDFEDSTSNFAIGQCITVTPLQMAGAINAVVNDGVYIKPNIIEGYVDNDNNLIQSQDVEESRVFSTTTSELVKQSMINEIWLGTGYEAKVEDIVEGGKTGTSTGEGGGTNHGWFAGFFELGGKSYTMVVVAPDIGETHPDGRELGGGNTGAPIFRDIINAIKN